MKDQTVKNRTNVKKILQVIKIISLKLKHSESNDSTDDGII